MGYTCRGAHSYTLQIYFDVVGVLSLLQKELGGLTFEKSQEFEGNY